MAGYAIGDEVLSGWKIVRSIGEGSFGKVFEVQKQSLGVVRSALKAISIPPSDTIVAEALAQGMDEQSVAGYFRDIADDFLREVDLLSSLSHPGVVGYMDHEVVPHPDGFGWDILLRMELLLPLLQLMREHPLNTDETVRLGAEIADALAFCHSRGIIHRDVKPGNVFVDTLGRFKLGDFGVSRTAEHTMGAFSRKGTEDYMAPELYLGGEYGASVDVYALGITLYQLLNGNRLPFLPPAPAPVGFRDREQARARRLSGEPLPYPTSCDEELFAIIARACASDPTNRPPAIELRDELWAYWRAHDMAPRSQENEKAQEATLPQPTQTPSSSTQQPPLQTAATPTVMPTEHVWHAFGATAPSISPATDAEMAHHTPTQAQHAEAPSNEPPKEPDSSPRALDVKGFILGSFEELVRRHPTDICFSDPDGLDYMVGRPHSLAGFNAIFGMKGSSDPRYAKADLRAAFHIPRDEEIILAWDGSVFADLFGLLDGDWGVDPEELEEICERIDTIRYSFRYGIALGARGLYALGEMGEYTFGDHAFIPWESLPGINWRIVSEPIRDNDLSRALSIDGSDENGGYRNYQLEFPSQDSALTIPLFITKRDMGFLEYLLNAFSRENAPIDGIDPDDVKAVNRSEDGWRILAIPKSFTVYREFNPNGFIDHFLENHASWKPSIWNRQKLSDPNASPSPHVLIKKHYGISDIDIAKARFAWSAEQKHPLAKGLLATDEWVFANGTGFPNGVSRIHLADADKISVSVQTVRKALITRAIIVIDGFDHGPSRVEFTCNKDDAEWIVEFFDALRHALAEFRQ